MRATPIWLIAALFVVVPLLNGCSSSSFDPTDWADNLDIFNVNKDQKLKGERKALFPEGVPGVTQGIPPDLVKGYKPPETAAVTQEEPQQEKPKPKPRVVHRAAPTRIQVSPAQQPQQAQQQQQAPWPSTKPQQAQQQQQNGAQSPWQEPPKQSSPWPDAPAPNTFQR